MNQATTLDVDIGAAPPHGTPTSLTFSIANLHCAGCIRTIEAGLGKIPGVDHARVNLTARRVTVVGDGTRVDADGIVAALTDLGYDAAPLAAALTAPASRAADDEDTYLLRCLGVAGFAAMNIMLLSVSVWAGWASDMGPATRGLMHWISALLALPTIAYSGRPFFTSAWAALRGRRLNMDVPISLAVLLAGGMSLAETMRGAPEVYFDAAVTLLFFLLVGRYLDRRMRTRAYSLAENLLSLRDTTAVVMAADGTRVPMAIDGLMPGMTVAVPPGGRVPTDGIVAAGQSDLDASLITGESLPQAVGPGAAVHAGTVNLSAELLIDVKTPADQSLLAEIAGLMEAAQQNRSAYVRLADRAATLYAPIVHLTAAATFAGWMLLGDVGWQAALVIAIAVLIITCPCALGLSVPIVQVVASGHLFRRGLLIKAGDALERLAGADVVVFDKTGTLTLGRPELDNRPDIPQQALDGAAAMAATSRHPLAQAIVRAAGPVAAMADVKEVPGRGLVAGAAGRETRLGSHAWCGVPEEDRDETRSELWLATPDAPPVRFLFRDRPRPDAAEAVARLRQLGLDVRMLSGDRPAVARDVAAKVGITDWRAAMLPAAKVAYLDDLRRDGRRVLMVGDGLNDAPALAAADVSMSPGTAADVSQVAADVLFQGKHLMPVVDGLCVARKARRLMLQNFGLSVAYNLVAVPLAIAGLATPLMAAVAMSTSSLLVTANALRARLGTGAAR